jgi:hypothetical protein
MDELRSTQRVLRSFSKTVMSPHSAQDLMSALHQKKKGNCTINVSVLFQ